MTPKDLLLQFLATQQQAGIDSHDWAKLTPEENKCATSEGSNIILRSIEIGFSFDKDGNFEGIYNYKW